jgi:L-ascorbate metabolism protein UlaG (beta-lactamase superfamily)
MKIKFLGHASFLITSEGGVRIITDPYRADYSGLKYSPITEEADIVTISHEHGDHNETNIKGNPAIVEGVVERGIKGIKTKGIGSYHDDTEGSQRGPNTIYNILIDGMSVVHLGDLGHTLSPMQIEAIGKVDVLFIPVGGVYTIDAQTAQGVVEALKPKVVIPMHFKTKKCDFPIAPVDEFIKNKKVEKKDYEVEIKKQGLPEETTIYLLTPTK